MDPQEVLTNRDSNNPFDPERLRVSQAFEQMVGVKKPELPGEAAPYTLFTTITRQGDLFLWQVRVVAGVRGLELRLQPVDLWQALCLMLVSFTDRLRKCQNEKCPGSPYFIATRRDQKFCNENCSRLVANRRWWNAKGSQERREKRRRKAKARKSANQ